MPGLAVCSRPIVVPASPLGKMIVVDNATGQVSGIYPEMLREGGARIGCEFVFPIMSRARAEMMMPAGKADLLVGSVKSDERGAWGNFIAMTGTEWMLISNRSDAPPATVQELLDKPGIKLNVVRGFNYGPDYLAMLEKLERRGKLEYVKDAQTIVRKMQIGHADYAYMPSITFAGEVAALGLKDSLSKTVHYTRLGGIPTSSSGVYMSRALQKSDADQIQALLVQIRASGELLTRLQAIFTPEEMSSSYRLPEDRPGR
ncbi:substrate-binding periplasmic protein [Undibacterium sp. TJN25]|uniref:substrate-binding periplasmic protein n=1 Tax=Undibacterium sp. TJN25 TaxID=3413056 RepID=UPI003BF024A3